MPEKRAPGVRGRYLAIHDDLWAKVQAEAKAKGIPLVEVVREALRRYLK